MGFNCTIAANTTPEKGRGEVSLYIVDKNGKEFLVRTLYLSGGVTSERIESTIDSTIDVSGALRFRIKGAAKSWIVRNPLTGEVFIYNSTIAFNATTFNFSSEINRLIIAPNGFAVVNATDDYAIMANGIKKIVSKNFDAPGTTRGGTVNGATGSSSAKWGSELCASSKVSAVRYKLTHFLEHNNYYPHFTPYADRRWYIVTKNSTYVEVQFLNSSGGAADTNFDYSISGQN